MKKALSYCRVSTDEQAFNTSLKSQDELNRAYAASKGYIVVGSLFEDFTGTLPDRPEMDKALAMHRRGEIDVLICMCVDRYARDLPAHVILNARWGRNNVEYATQNFDDSPSGQLHENMMAVLAAHERQVILQRSMRGRSERAKSGKVLVICDKRPYGYEYRDDMFWPDPLEAAAVRQMYHWYVVEKLGLIPITRRLNDLGVKPRLSDTWGYSSIRVILKNPLYRGEWKWNGITVPVPPIVDVDLWNAAQEQLTANTKRGGNANAGRLLARRLRCEACGLSMGARTAFERGKEFAYYRCGVNKDGNYGTETCSHYVQAKPLEAIAWSAICEIIRNPDAIRQALEFEYNRVQNSRESVEHQLDAIQLEIDQAEREAANLVKALARMDADVQTAFIEPELKRLAERKAMLEAGKGRLEKERSQIGVGGVAPERTLAVMKMLADKLPNASLETRQKIFDMLEIKGVLSADRKSLVLTGLIPNLHIDLSSDSTSGNTNAITRQAFSVVVQL